jgi:DNA mismatch repair protein MutS
MAVLIYDQYKSFYNEKAVKYGKCAVLLQIGGFFELYGKDNEIDTNASEISSKLSIEFVLKDKVKGQKMAGIPVYKYDKYKNILLKLGYTVLKIEQVKETYICSPELIFGDNEKSGKLEKRVITEIVSPGTDTNSTELQNYIVSLYIEGFNMSVAVTDTNISNVIYVYETVYNKEDKGYSKGKVTDDITRLLTLYPGSEYIITKNKNQEGFTKEIVSLLGIKGIIHEIYTEEIKSLYTDASFLLRYTISALKQFLSNRLYPTDSLTIEYIKTNNLELTYNCAKQLDLHLLYNLLNKCSTPMGSRLLYNRLYKPLIDDTLIQESLNSIENIKTCTAQEYKQLFGNFCDFDKVIQGLSKGIVSKSKFKHFYDNLVILKQTPSIYEGIKEPLDILLEFMDKRVFFGENVSFVGNIELDDLYTKKLAIEQTQAEFMEDINYSLQKACKVKNILSTQVDLKIKDNCVVLSHLRAITVQKDCPGWVYTKKTNETLVTCPEFTDACIRKTDISECISQLEKELFINLQLEMSSYREILKQVSEHIQLLDFYQSAKNVCNTFKLTKPTLTTQPLLEINGLRHLLVEEYNQETEYITNDLLFDQDKYGSVIYGCNSSGKSCLLKATGLIVIMAQAGLFVPAQSMKFKPLECIMTRIIGGDDIEKGKSSFIVELSEISSILHRSNEKTLVLVDEASKGSETESASAINYALVKYLVLCRSFFLSTTHLHNLSKEFSEIPEINVFNMRIVLGENGESLVFERKLQKGSGIPLYGLEVAKVLKFPKDFLDIAFFYRDNRTKLVTKSKYNSKSLKISCKMCGYSPKTQTDLSLDTHHINFQCNAVNNYNGVYHKNRLSNLITLCKVCHVKVHTEQIQLDLKQTLHW